MIWLGKIFAEMNPVVRDKQNITHVTYGNRKINYYIKKNKISKNDRKVLKKYVETDCKLLCAVVTAAKGFVRASVGDDVSEERVNVISAAYSLVGKVGYFWGGKSTKIGTDPSWGTAEKVSAEGSKSTGTVRAYGLDCSGFVTWAVINGYQDQTMQAAVGDGTSDQWEKANVVTETDAQPGDLVFQKGPEAGSDNHVGILCGKTDAGDSIAVHCAFSLQQERSYSRRGLQRKLPLHPSAVFLSYRGTDPGNAEQQHSHQFRQRYLYCRCKGKQYPAGCH